MSNRPTVLLGLGSNLPWREHSSQALIRGAADTLRAYATGGFQLSALYRTSPVDCPPDSGDFVNAAIAMTVSERLTPGVLLSAAKAIERRHGRAADAPRNSPRPLDIDVLAFSDRILRSERLTLPHPRAIDRAFVLVPLAEVAPDFNWPGTDLSVAELLDRLESDETVCTISAAPA